MAEKENLFTEWIHGNFFHATFDDAQNSSDFVILMVVLDKGKLINTGELTVLLV